MLLQSIFSFNMRTLWTRLWNLLKTFLLCKPSISSTNKNGYKDSHPSMSVRYTFMSPPHGRGAKGGSQLFTKPVIWSVVVSLCVLVYWCTNIMYAVLCVSVLSLCTKKRKAFDVLFFITLKWVHLHTFFPAFPWTYHAPPHKKKYEQNDHTIYATIPDIDI